MPILSHDRNQMGYSAAYTHVYGCGESGPAWTLAAREAIALCGVEELGPRETPGRNNRPECTSYGQYAKRAASAAR
jgi:hypothetical protein